VTQKVAIITGGSQGIGAALVAGYRARGWAVVANARTMAVPPDPDVLAVQGDVAGFFWLTQRVIGKMLACGGGHVVNISAAIAEVCDAGTPAVLTALTKGGLAAATRSLAVENASRGIRVNAVAPGVIQTHPDASYADLGSQSPPMGRAGQIADVVDGILFLESAPYITGEILHIARLAVPGPHQRRDRRSAVHQRPRAQVADRR
jgi:NAD(P)-dependent dehydrogenase (short-subunit alcohol dehydrogenase family)